MPATPAHTPATLIHEFLEYSALRTPERLAVVHQAERVSYREVNQRANRLAHWLIHRGISPGDRIGFIMENSVDYVAVYYGILKSGAVAVPLSTDIKPDTLKVLLADLEPAAVIGSARHERLLWATEISDAVSLVIASPKLNWTKRAAALTALDDILVAGNGDDNPDLRLAPRSLASIIYTSGSTGIPKGVMLSHGNIVHNTQSICTYLELTSRDVQMVILPFFYVMGKSLLNTHFAVGGRVVINNQFAYPASVLKEMREEKITGFSGVPSTYAYLLHRSPLAKYRDQLANLRYCSQAGGHMSAQIKRELLSVLPKHTKLIIMYGATEASARLAYLPPSALASKLESIGIAIPDVTLEIVDSQGLERPEGKEGELVASGANIMLGYWQDPESTAKVLRDGKYHTGDVGYRDTDGFFFLKGRKDNILKVGGHRINPQEIEDAMMATGLLVETCALGVPDSMLGYRIAALAVAKKQQCSQNEFLGILADKLPKYKMPHWVYFVRSLVKNSSGKIDRQGCRQILKKHGIPI